MGTGAGIKSRTRVNEKEGLWSPLSLFGEVIVDVMRENHRSEDRRKQLTISRGGQRRMSSIGIEQSIPRKSLKKERSVLKVPQQVKKNTNG